MKNNNIYGIAGKLLVFLLLAGVTVGVIATYPYCLKKSKVLLEDMKNQEEYLSIQQEEYNRENFITNLYQGIYSLYSVMAEENEGEFLSNGSIYLPELKKELDEAENQEKSEEEAANDIYVQKQYLMESFEQMLEDITMRFFSQSIDMFGLEYYIRDDKTGKVLTNSIIDLTLLEDDKTTGDLAKEYSFYTVLKYDQDGILSIPYFNGFPESNKKQLMNLERTKSFFKEYLGSDYYLYGQYLSEMKNPKDYTIIFAAKDYQFYNNYGYRSKDILAFHRAGFVYVVIAALTVVTLLALLLPFIKPIQLGKGLATKLLFEISLAGIVVVFKLYESLIYMAVQTVQSKFLIFDKTIISNTGARFIRYSLNSIIWFGVFFLWFLAVLSLRCIFTKGLKRYIKENTLLGIVFTACKKVLFTVRSIDLTENSNKQIIKIVALNFFVLVLICSIWVVGIAALIPYSIVLFLILRKNYQDLQQKYQVLLEAAGKMAQGNLEVGIPEELGVFEPLKEELTKVQVGFKKAVEEEMKSQKMKTELITNVSHDLKTPLTAIITYVNLLKDNNLSEEERISYIETLDKKSMRLKRLIEDLFEMSKASSNSVTMNLVEVDISALIKQVQLELGDKIEETDIEFRTSFPQKKIIVLLDSEKTYRVFENLFINVLKYAMPHTRAYIEVKEAGEKVIVILKNISATEMEFKGEEISERFVRGDKSRGTEGSGLGLAIVKSFVELQGGKFSIQLDGDLFKAILEFNLASSAADLEYPL